MDILEPIHAVSGGLQSSSFVSSGSEYDSVSSSRPKTCCAVAMLTTVLIQQNGYCPTNTSDDISSEGMVSHSKKSALSLPVVEELRSPKKNSKVIDELNRDLESKNEEIRLLQEVSRLRFSQLKQKYESLEEEHERVVCEKIRQLDLYRKRLQLRDEVVKTLTEDCNGLQEALRAKLDEQEQEDEGKNSCGLDAGEEVEVGKMFEQQQKNIDLIAQQQQTQANLQIPVQAKVQMPQKIQVKVPAQVTLTETKPKSLSSIRGANDRKSASTDASLTVILPKKHVHHSRHNKHNSQNNSFASPSKKKSTNKGPKTVNDKGLYQPDFNGALKSAKTVALLLPTKRNKLHLRLSPPREKQTLLGTIQTLKTTSIDKTDKTADSARGKKRCLPSTSSSLISNGRSGVTTFTSDSPESNDSNDDIQAIPCTVINNSQHVTPISPINLHPLETEPNDNVISSSSSKSSPSTIFEEKNALTYEDHSEQQATKEEQHKLRSVVKMKTDMSICVKIYRNDIDACVAADEIASGGYSEKGDTNDSNHDSIPSALVLPPNNIDRTLGCGHWFPLKLHTALDLIEEEGHSDIISWQPHGRAILIHDQSRFVSTVMPVYFRQSKISSFQRQLNLYGFQRITKSIDKGAYWHENFLRGMPHLCLRMKRHRVKGNRVRGASNPDLEPHFYAMKPVCCNTSTPLPSSLTP